MQHVQEKDIVSKESALKVGPVEQKRKDNE